MGLWSSLASLHRLIQFVILLPVNLAKLISSIFWLNYAIITTALGTICALLNGCKQLLILAVSSLFSFLCWIAISCYQLVVLAYNGLYNSILALLNSISQLFIAIISIFTATLDSIRQFVNSLLAIVTNIFTVTQRQQEEIARSENEEQERCDNNKDYNFYQSTDKSLDFLSTENDDILAEETFTSSLNTFFAYFGYFILLILSLLFTTILIFSLALAFRRFTRWRQRRQLVNSAIYIPDDSDNSSIYDEVNESRLTRSELRKRLHEARSVNRCVVCLSRPRRVVLVPCQHACLCVSCTATIVNMSTERSCPICRQHFYTAQQIYL